MNPTGQFGTVGGAAHDWYPAAGAAPSLARPTETIVPARLGRSFRWLLAAATVNNIGDGVVIAAGPLLVASQTSDPFLVSMAVLSEYLPTLLFGVLGGAAADRFDRRRMVDRRQPRAAPSPWSSSSPRSSPANVSIAVVLITLFVLGTAETFADSASSTLLPGLVVPRGPGPRQRPDAGRLPPHQPAGRAADRRLPVRRRDGAPVRDERGLLRRSARCSSRASSRVRGSSDPKRPSLRTEMSEGLPLAPRAIRRCGPSR